MYTNTYLTLLILILSTEGILCSGGKHSHERVDCTMSKELMGVENNSCKKTKVYVDVDKTTGRWPLGLSWVLAADEINSGFRGMSDSTMLVEDGQQFSHFTSDSCSRFVTELCLEGHYMFYSNAGPDVDGVNVEFCDTAVAPGEAFDFEIFGGRCNAALTDNASASQPGRLKRVDAAATGSAEVSTMDSIAQFTKASLESADTALSLSLSIFYTPSSSVPSSSSPSSSIPTSSVPSSNIPSSSSPSSSIPTSSVPSSNIPSSSSPSSSIPTSSVPSSSIPSSSSPSSIPTSSVPSSIPSSSSPTSKILPPPTFAPTMTDRVQVTYSVDQTLNGIDVATWNLDKATNDLIFQTTAAQGAGLEYIDDIMINTIKPSSSLNAKNIRFSQVYETATGVDILYTVQYVLGEGNSWTSPSQSSDALKQNIQSGQFTSSLNSNADTISNGTSPLTSAVSDKDVSITEPEVKNLDTSTTSDKDNGLSDGEIAAAVVVPLVVIILIAMAYAYYVASIKAGPNLTDMAAERNSPNLVPNPAIYRENAPSSRGSSFDRATAGRVGDPNLASSNFGSNYTSSKMTAERNYPNLVPNPAIYRENSPGDLGPSFDRATAGRVQRVGDPNLASSNFGSNNTRSNMAAERNSPNLAPNPAIYRENSPSGRESSFDRATAGRIQRVEGPNLASSNFGSNFTSSNFGDGPITEESRTSVQSKMSFDAL